MSFKPAIPTMSLGRNTSHALPPRLHAAALHGYHGIELFYDDLLTHALALSPHSVTPSGQPTHSSILAATHDVASICTSLSLSIISLQPLMHSEGLLSATAHSQNITKLHLWFEICHILQTDLILVPSSFLPASETTGDFQTVVRDLQEIADLGAQQNPPFRFCYEALCWGTWTNVWEKSWDIVQAVDRPNFGLCLDTFNILGRIWADPASASASRTTEDCEQVLQKSLENLKEVVRTETAKGEKSRIFFVQVEDAEKCTERLVEGHEWYNPEQPARMSWSRNARAFYGEGYLPVKEIMEILCPKDGTGYQGWISLEVFTRTTAEKGEGVPGEHARKGMESWNLMARDLGWGEENLMHAMEVGMVSEQHEDEKVVVEHFEGKGADFRSELRRVDSPRL